MLKIDLGVGCSRLLVASCKTGGAGGLGGVCVWWMLSLMVLLSSCWGIAVAAAGKLVVDAVAVSKFDSQSCLC